MSLEPQPVPVRGETLGSLNGCFVEGDPEQRVRERRVRRRALIISVGLQTAVVAALILLPIFAKPERIVVGGVTPLPPYHRVGPQQIADSTNRLHHRPIRDLTIYQPTRVPTTILRDTTPPDGIEARELVGFGPDIPGALPGLESRSGPVPPAPIQPRPDQPRVVHVTHVDPALLIHRVDPVYPTLARQIGRAGRVELRAIISTDGTIQSLQVVSGDPLFYQSALDAVRQWRYTPTVLNGQPVEVDTFVTVIYNMPR